MISRATWRLLYLLIKLSYPYTDSSYLHDDRARTLEEAILWHGGKAETTKERFRTFFKTDRTALIQFLKSL